MEEGSTPPAPAVAGESLPVPVQTPGSDNKSGGLLPWIQEVLALLGSALAGRAFQQAHALWWRFVLLYICVRLLLFVAIKLTGRTHWYFLRVPGYAQKRLGDALASAASLVWLLIATTQWWQQCLAAALLALTVGLLVRICWLSLGFSLTLRHLWTDYQNGRAPRLQPPHVFIWLVGFNARRSLYGRLYLFARSAGRIATLRSMAVHDSRGPLSDLPEPPDQLQVMAALRLFGGTLLQIVRANLLPVGLITSDDLAHEPEGFADWVRHQAVMIVAVPPVLSRLRYVLLNKEPTRSEDPQIAAVAEALQQMVPARARQLGTHVRKGTQAEEFGLHKLLHLAPVPGIVVNDEPVAMQLHREPADRLSNPHGYMTTNEAFNKNATIGKIVQCLSNCAAPLAYADRALSDAERRTVTELGARGLAPLADVYLRFRLSSSHIERFLNLIDCFEVLIKWSVIGIVVSRITPVEVNIPRQIERPSLGHWIDTLREVLSSPGSTDDAGRFLRGEIAHAWDQSCEFYTAAIQAADEIGMVWKGNMPGNRFEWLRWLVWLRNKTKGHGGLSEEDCASLWPALHRALLSAVDGLRRLALEDYLVAGFPTYRPLRGWLRGPCRSSTLAWDELPFAEQDFLPCLIDGEQEFEFPLYPFVQFHRQNCLIWNAGKEGDAEFIDYATGQIKRVRWHMTP